MFISVTKQTWVSLVFLRKEVLTILITYIHIFCLDMPMFIKPANYFISILYLHSPFCPTIVLILTPQTSGVEGAFLRFFFFFGFVNDISDSLGGGGANLSLQNLIRMITKCFSVLHFLYSMYTGRNQSFPREVHIGALSFRNSIEWDLQVQSSSGPNRVIKLEASIRSIKMTLDKSFKS